MVRFTRAFAVLLVGVFAMLAIPAMAEAACKTYKHRAKIESDPFNGDLAYLNIQIRACYNGSRITKAQTLEIEPAFTNNALGSMEFGGVSPDPIAEYRTWHGRKKGSYYVKAGGNFKQNLGPISGRSSYIWASMRIFGNGKVEKDRKND